MEKNPQVLRPFGLILAVFLGGIIGGVLPALGAFSFQPWLWLVAVVLAMIALIVPVALAPVHWAWLKLGGVLGWVNTRLLLGLVFFAVIWPMGFARRLLGGGGVRQSHDPDAVSYRVPSVTERDPGYFEKPY